MKKETQAIEFKQSWRDEYLEWICGYANAYGGTLYIGRADDGAPVGVAKAKALMESIPCKITDTMGIIADVNLLNAGGKDVIEIKVEKYPSLISYHGKYFYRSGTTMRTISGKELDKLILKQQGMTWDSVPVPKLKIGDLDSNAVRYFKNEAVRRNRLSRDAVKVSRDLLMRNLRLVDDEGYLTRAAMLAFYPDPERWVTGAYVKIGYFESSDSDLRYQDEIHGPLIEQAAKVVDLVYTKYLKALISYEGITRVERFMFSRDAFREIVLNAIVHKDYSSNNPIQISVYPDKIYVWNNGTMPKNLDSVEKLFDKHSSDPFNPNLAQVFFKSGLIEAWGRGFDKIKAGCEEYGGELPAYEISENGIMVLCKACPSYLAMLGNGADQVHGSEVKSKGKSKGKSKVKSKGKNEDRIIALLVSNPYLRQSEIAAKVGLSLPGVEKIMRRLRSEGKLVREGSSRNGCWKVVLE